jgi:hypothetical protein
MSYCSDTLPKLQAALEHSWNKETCYPPLQEEWTEENSAFGQCAVTALIVQDFFGGDILFCDHQNHAWNKLPDGTEIDLTRSQFPSDIMLCSDGVIDRQGFLYGEAALNAKTLVRYLDLKRRVISFF